MTIYTNELLDRADIDNVPDDYLMEAQRQCAWRALRDALQSTPHSAHASLLCNILASLIDDADNPLELAAAISRGRA